jgi:hypothetical protein
LETNVVLKPDFHGTNSDGNDKIPFITTTSSSLADPNAILTFLVPSAYDESPTSHYYSQSGHIDIETNMIGKLLSNALMPGFERQVASSIEKTVATMTLDMAPPQVFAFARTAASSNAAFTASAVRSAPMQKITYPAKPQSMFADRPSWHR